MKFLWHVPIMFCFVPYSIWSPANHKCWIWRRRKSQIIFSSKSWSKIFWKWKSKKKKLVKIFFFQLKIFFFNSIYFFENILRFDISKKYFQILRFWKNIFRFRIWKKKSDFQILSKNQIFNFWDFWKFQILLDFHNLSSILTRF